MAAEKRLKACTTCGETKEYILFSLNKNKKDGHNNICKSCVNHYYAQNKKKYSENAKIRYQKNKEEICNRVKDYRLKNASDIKSKKQQNYIKKKEKILLQHKIYEEKNKEKMTQVRRIYLLNNLEKMKEYKKEWRRKDMKENPLKYRERDRKYRKTPMGKAVQFYNRHKRRELIKSGNIDSNKLAKLQQNAKVCYWCNVSLKDAKVHIDHYVPLSKGGSHTLNNLVVSCSKCNLHKGAKDPLEFANSIGKLL